MSAARRKWTIQTLVGLIMLPLSLVPFGLYFDRTQEGAILWAKVETAITPPVAEPPGPQELQWIHDRAPRYTGAVALLVYHGLGTGAAGGEGRFTVSPERFAEQLVSLRAAGMIDVTATDVALAFAGIKPLPPNAVMISFDDGRTDAMLYADPVLEQLDMRATMFAISSAAQDPGVYYADWGMLRGYAESGRWDLQSHSHEAHHEHEVSPGRTLPALTSLAPGETPAEFADRVRSDLSVSAAAVERETGTAPLAFAYPFGAYGGDDRTNHPGAREVIREAVSSEHLVAFNQDEQDAWGLASCGQDPYALPRLEVGDWSGKQLLSRIAVGAARPVATPDCSDVFLSGAGRERREQLAPEVLRRLRQAAAAVGADGRGEGLAVRNARRLPPFAMPMGDAVSGCQSFGGGCLLPHPSLLDEWLPMLEGSPLGILDALGGPVWGGAVPFPPAPWGAGPLPGVWPSPPADRRAPSGDAVSGTPSAPDGSGGGTRRTGGGAPSGGGGDGGTSSGGGEGGGTPSGGAGGGGTLSRGGGTPSGGGGGSGGPSPDNGSSSPPGSSRPGDGGARSSSPKAPKTSTGSTSAGGAKHNADEGPTPTQPSGTERDTPDPAPSGGKKQPQQRG